MKIALGSDERTHLTDFLIEELKKRGHQVETFGPLADQAQDWPDVSRAVAECVVRGQADEGIVCCWTGTGASIAANKVPGVRAALCHDAETARGARIWNRANVLALSLRATSEPIAKEILDAWFSTPFVSETSGDANTREFVQRTLRQLDALEQQYTSLPEH